MTGIVTFGETMMVLASPKVGPLRHAGQLRMSIAGAESNVAIGAARLGVPATWIGRVGDDEPGRLISSALRGEGVAVEAIVDDSAATGLMLKERRTSGSTSVMYYRTGSAGSRLRPDDLAEGVIGDAEVLHISGITPALSASARAATQAAVDIAVAHGVPVSLDVNYRSRLWSRGEASVVIGALARRADIIFAGEDEIELATGSPAESSLGALKAAEVVIKRGSRGASAVLDGELHEAPLYSVAVVDPVGAGDAFAAGYLAARCRGLSPRERLEVGAATGAFAVSVEGDWEGAPTWQELALLRGGADDVRR